MTGNATSSTSTNDDDADLRMQRRKRGVASKGTGSQRCEDATAGRLKQRPANRVAGTEGPRALAQRAHDDRPKL